MTEIPQEVIDAAARVLSADPGDMDAKVWARAVLEASRRFIAAAERERIRRLAECMDARYEADCTGATTTVTHKASLPFADLIREGP